VSEEGKYVAFHRATGRQKQSSSHPNSSEAPLSSAQFLGRLSKVAKRTNVGQWVKEPRSRSATSLLGSISAFECRRNRGTVGHFSSAEQPKCRRVFGLACVLRSIGLKAPPSKGRKAVRVLLGELGTRRLY
jgi:hypothetical protein